MFFVLYEKIKQKKTPVVYKTDKIANLHVHEVLRTPVGHCELNPIELIWAQVKGFSFCCCCVKLFCVLFMCYNQYKLNNSSDPR
jgi:transposase